MSDCAKYEEPVTTFYLMDEAGNHYHSEDYHHKDCYGHRNDNLVFFDDRWIAPEKLSKAKEEWSLRQQNCNLCSGKIGNTDFRLDQNSSHPVHEMCLQTHLRMQDGK